MILAGYRVRPFGTTLLEEPLRSRARLHLLPEPLLYLNAYFERHRGAYYNRLLAVSREEGAWGDWLLFFLRGILTEARDAAHRVQTLFDLREAYRERFLREGRGANLLAAVERLFSQPVADIRELESPPNVSFEAARGLANRLKGEGVLQEITVRPRDRAYATWEIARALQRPLGEE